MAEASETEPHSLDKTPTWAVALVFFVLISLSILIEHGLHLLAKYFTKRRRKAIIQALDTIKSDLMLLGFISLLLTVCEKPIANICIPKNVAESFIPCKDFESKETEESKCESEGKMSLMSRKGVQQLQMLIFFLAFFHVVLSFLTFSLGIAKMRRWNSWEAETRTLEYKFSNDPRRFQLIHQTSFGKRHLKFWSEHRILRLPAVFLRQFYASVYKVDYFVLRHGFVMAHLSEGTNFDFQRYIRRALEKDFGVVVGISLWIWIFSVLFIFFNAYVFYKYLWLPFVPLLMLLVIGTKLQSIITKMCLDSLNKSNVIRGTLLVKPSDQFFWFGKPKLLLHLIHLILFQNSFQLAFFCWSWYKFGLRSCFHRTTEDIVIGLVVGLIVHILCGYVTLPLYALVTQMGTSMGDAIFPDGVFSGLKRWRGRARKNITRKKFNIPASLSSNTLNTSSPSFSTLDASLSLELGYSRNADDWISSLDNEYQENRDGKRPELDDKYGSFEGFDLNRVHKNSFEISQSPKIEPVGLSSWIGV